MLRLLTHSLTCLLACPLCRYDAFKLFPGHAIFHVLMAFGLLQCLVYPSIMRASVFGAHPRFLIESAWLQPPEPPPEQPIHRVLSHQRAVVAGGEEEQGQSRLPMQITRADQCKARSREAFRRTAVGYLTLFPAITFVRSPLHEKVSSGDETDQSQLPSPVAELSAQSLPAPSAAAEVQPVIQTV